ncbi:Endochitinase 1 [Bulinus truncatus]|nr:Endochitinase 1 [Bulinus truncatus]
MFTGEYGANRIFINPIYCTHVVLYHAEVRPNQEVDLVGRAYKLEVDHIMELKKQTPNLKTILAVQNNDKIDYQPPIRFADFVRMYTTENLRKDFIRNIIYFVRNLNIDGVKIDVQPAEGGDKEKFTQLIKDLKAAFIEESSRTKKQRLLLTVGIPPDKSFLDKYYDVLAISNYVDMVDLATYNFQPINQCTQSPQHHSPLYSKDPSSTRTIDYMFV